jgi:hypothetical protein
VLSSALALARCGMAIFPCRVRDKRPATANGCNDATRDLDQIRAWWRQDENFNIGVATGTPSNLFVVDVDDDGGEYALLKLGVLPNTVEAITARGRHIYFRMPPKIAIGNSASKIAEHVDVRGTGGYVLAPPSVHPSGRRYAWSVDCAGAIADAPQWLLNKLITRTAKTPAQSIQEWHQLARDVVREGGRNDTITKHCGYMLAHGLGARYTLEMCLSWNEAHCVPPLDDNEVVQIVNSIAGREIKKRAR